MSTPRYSYQAINQLASDDTGRFVFLDAWSINLLGSMLSQERPLYLWANDQNPLSESEIDDLDNKLSTAQEQLMETLVGLIMPVCTSALPAGTLLCDGATYARVDYPNLYDALDAAFIIDADNFMVPDMRDKFVMSAGTDHAAATTGGSFSLTQTIAEMPNHAHATDPHSHTEITAVPAIGAAVVGVPVPSAVPSAGVTGLSTVTVQGIGGGDAMDITNAYIALKYVVVAL